MRTDTSRRPRHSMTVWSLAFVGFSGIFTWYMGWLPVSVESPETGKLADENTAEFEFPGGEEPFNNSFDGNRPQQNFDEADPLAFNSQNEPPVQEGATSDVSMLAQSEQAVERDDPEPAEPPFRPPASFAAKPAGKTAMPFPARAPETTVARGEVKTAAISRFDANADQVGRVDQSIVQMGGEVAETPQVPAAAAAKLAQIDQLLNDDNRLAAHRELSTLYWVKPEWRSLIKGRIDQTSHTIYFADHPHFMQPYEVQTGDRLQSIAKQYNVPWEYLVRLNRIDPRKIRPGQKLKVIKGPFSARIDLSDFELTIHAHGYFVHRFRVGIGKDDRTPVGRFKVENKVVNPTYFGSDGNVIDANDPQNPLGERWIDIGDSYGIHGTIAPDSIGRAESKGCIRLLNDEVEVVYDLLSVGSEVVIRK